MGNAPIDPRRVRAGDPRAVGTHINSTGTLPVQRAPFLGSLHGNTSGRDVQYEPNFQNMIPAQHAPVSQYASTHHTNRVSGVQNIVPPTGSLLFQHAPSQHTQPVVHAPLHSILVLHLT